MGGLVLLFMRYVMAAIFIKSGAVKLASRRGFRSAVAGYKLLPASLVTPVAAAVALAEALCGILVLLGIYGSVASFILVFLLLAFSAAMGINLAGGRVIDCGCGGTEFAAISWRHVGVDLLLAASAGGMAVFFPSAMAIISGPGTYFTLRVPAGSALGTLLTALLCLVAWRSLRAAWRVRLLAARAR